LLGNNIDIDFKHRTRETTSKNQKKVYLLLVFTGCFFLACLVRVRAQAARKKQPVKTRRRYTGPDDSGSKLRDKEQQRLSSK